MEDNYGVKINKFKKLNFSKLVKKAKEHSKLFIIIASILGVLILGIILFNANVGGIKDMVTSSELEVVANKLYYEYPDDMNVNRDEEVVLINNSEDYLFGIVYSSVDGYEEKLEDIIKLYGKTFTKNAASRTIGNIYDAEIKLASTEKIKIKGYDSIKFIGSVKNKGTVAGWDCYVCGYTYVIDGQPIMVIGLVSTKKQNVKLINDVSDITERIASSVRTKK